MAGRRAHGLLALLVFFLFGFASCDGQASDPEPASRLEGIRIVNTYRDGIRHAIGNSVVLDDDPFRLGLEWSPADVSDEIKAKLVWESSAPEVMECASDGTLTPKAAGSAIITARVEHDGATASDSLAFLVFESDSANDQESSGFTYYFYWDEGDAYDKVFLSTYNGDAKRVEIPEKIRFNGYACDVVSIGNSAFKDNRNIEEVVLPDTVKKLDEFAFMGCDSLASVKSSTGLESIGSSCFQGCSSLLSFTFHENLKTIGNSAFSACGKLVEINNYSPFLDIDLDDENAWSGSYFGGVASNAVRINTDAAQESDSLMSKIGKITYFRNGDGRLIALQADKDSVSLAIDGSCASIYAGAFARLPDLASVDLSVASVSMIGKEAFYACPKLSVVTLNDGLEFIGERAFCNCSSLTEIAIPDSVVELSESIFDGCLNLESLAVPFIGKYADESNEEKYPLGYLFSGFERDGFYEAYQNYAHEGDAGFYHSRYFLPLKLKTVSVTKSTVLTPEAFENCVSLENVILNDGMTEIGARAFRNCVGIKDIVIPDSVETFKCVVNMDHMANSYPFDGCRFDSVEYGRSGSDSSSGAYEYRNGKLTIRQMPSSTNTIPLWSRDGLNQLILNVVFDTQNEPAFIPKECFMHAFNLESVTLPSAISSIGDGAFACCTSFKRFDPSGPSGASDDFALPSHITSIGENAFAFCLSLENVEVPSSVASIGSGAFGGCASISSISLPFVGAEANPAFAGRRLFGYVFGSNSRFKSDLMRQVDHFSDGNSTYSYYIPKSIRNVTISGGTVGAYAFSNCQDIESVVLGDDVGSVGEMSFASCLSLKSIRLPTGLSALGSKSFAGCVSLSSIVIPASCVSIPLLAFAKLIRTDDWELRICLGRDSGPLPAGFVQGWNIRQAAYESNFNDVDFNDSTYHPYYFHSEDEPSSDPVEGSAGYWHYASQDSDETAIWGVPEG